MKTIPSVVGNDPEDLNDIPLKDIKVERLAKNIALLLRHLDQDDLEPAVVKQVVVAACWWTSSKLGRKADTPHRSEAAHAELAKPTGWVKGVFEHDHAIPRTYIVDRILALRGPAPDVAEIKRLLELSFETLLLKAEHGSMPDKTPLPEGWDEQDLFVRYKAAGDWPGIAIHKD